MSGPVALRYQIAAAATGLLALLSLYRFVVSIRRDRLVADTPLVKIRSAAQGYVKVYGRAKPAGDSPGRSPLSSRTCVWWNYCVEQRVRDNRSENRWVLVDSATSVEPFVLADADAECWVGPVNAEITPTSRDVWYGSTARPSYLPGQLGSLYDGGDFRYSESLLSIDDWLSVTGELRSESELNSAESATASLLRQWKQNQTALLGRFDLNHDGRLDASEWEAARQAAAAEAQIQMLKAPVVRSSVIGEPTHGEPFLIAPMNAARLVRREKWHAVLFLALGLMFIVLCAEALEREFALSGRRADAQPRVGNSPSVETADSRSTERTAD